MKKFLPILVVLMLLVSIVIPTVAMADYEDEYAQKLASGGPAKTKGDLVMTTLAAIPVHDGDEITIEAGNTYIVDSGASVKLKMVSGAPVITNTMILAGGNSIVTIANLNIDLSGTPFSSPIVFVGGGNQLILEGDNTFVGADLFPGVEVNVPAELTIKGTGSIDATGGPGAAGIGSGVNIDAGILSIESGTINATGTLNGIIGAAGIGGGNGGRGGIINIFGGDITATGSNWAPGIGAGDFDGVAPLANTTVVNIFGGVVNATSPTGGAGIGGGWEADGAAVTIGGNAIVYAGSLGGSAIDIGHGSIATDPGTLTILDDAVVFYYEGTHPVAATTHTSAVPTPQLIAMYGPLPAMWLDYSAEIHYVEHNVIYYANGGVGVTNDTGAPYVGGNATIMANNFTKDGYQFAGWNTQSGGGGTAYEPGDSVSVPNEGIRLYAMWEAAVNPRTGEAGSYGFVFVLIAVMALMVVGFVVRRKDVVKE